VLKFSISLLGTYCVNDVFKQHFKQVTVQTESQATPLQKEMKKALRETQTLRAKNFRPAADPLPRGRRTAKI